MALLRVILTVIVAAGLLTSVAGCSDSSNNGIQSPQPEIMPVVFVHGQSGSAQQFETQAMRFTSNGYPQDMLFAFEYDTSKEDDPIGDLDTFIDAVLVQTGADRVYAVGHSRGTSLWTTYLDDPAFSGSEKVARYVNIDGRSPEELPGGVPTIGIWGEWNTANSGYNRREDNSNAQIGPDPGNNFYLGEKSHTETATSAEAFALMYEFLTGVAPSATEVTPVSSGLVNVAGRALLFPENLGYAGSTVQVWEVEPATGHRRTEDPIAIFEIDATGDFGPVTLTGGGSYEFELLRPATENFPADSHHFFALPYDHDNYFLRLLSSLPGESISAFIPTADDATGLLAMRQKEFWGDQGASSDQLFVNGLNVLTPQISPREATSGSGVNIAVFVFDGESDKITDLEKGELFPFNQLTFLTACDVFTPAVAGGTGSVEVVLVSRGEKEIRLNIPNWPSSSHRNTVLFRDDI